MKKIVIMVLVVIVVVLGGAGGLVMLGIVRNPFKPPPPPDAAAIAAAKAANKAPTEQLVLVKIPDMIVPVVTTSGVGRRVSISLRLVARSSADKTLLQCPPANYSDPDKGEQSTICARFQSALLQDLIAYFQTYFENHESLDIEALHEKALKHAIEVYGEAVKDILFVNVFETGAGSAGMAPG